MENSNQGFSSWLKERIRPTWILNSQSQLKHYQVEDLTAELETQQVGRIEQCGNLEQIKAFSPALSHGLQQVLRLNEQLLRDVLPVMCANEQVVLVVTAEALHSDAVRGLTQKLLGQGYAFNDCAYLVVDAAVLFALRRTLPTKEAATTAAAGNLITGTTQWTQAELYAMFIELVRWGVHNEASDLHINLHLGDSFSPVFYSIAGRYVQPSVFKSMHTALLRDMLAVTWMNIQGGNAPVFDAFQEQQGRLECEIDGQTVRLRWASLAAIEGPSVCFRILTKDQNQSFNLAELGYLPEQQQQLLEAALSARGAIVFSGSVGSGKSTALATLVRQLPPWRKVITLEDPVEYRIPRAVQVSLARELDEDTHQHFGAKLRALKRSAMTDVLLGEIRDQETAQAFTDLCTSGVRVFTTVHAAGVRLIPQRLSSSFIGVDPQLLDTPGVLRLLVHQELLPKLCKQCALPLTELSDYPADINAALYRFRPFDSWLAQVKALWGSAYSHLRVRNSDGCANCAVWQQRGLAGFNGRTVVAELWQPHTPNTASAAAHSNDGAALIKADQSKLLQHEAQSSIYATAWHKSLKGELDPFELEQCFGLFDQPHWQSLRPTDRKVGCARLSMV